MHLGLSYSISLHQRLRLGDASMVADYASEVGAGAVELASSKQPQLAVELLEAALDALAKIVADEECEDSLRLASAEQYALLTCDALQLLAALARRDRAELLLERARSVLLPFN